MKLSIIIPVYNEEKTLLKLLKKVEEVNLPSFKGKIIEKEIILVDDCSKDRTVEVTRNLGLKVIVHEKNTGYGGNQKTCYTEALKNDADIIIMLHPDYQYDARVIPSLVSFIKDGICDVMLGNRIRTRKEAISGGMPLYKYFANRFLTIFENLILGQNLGEWHSGLRAYSKKVLQTIPWRNNSDDFVFDQQFLIQCAYFGFRIGDIPVPAKYFEEASSINFIRSIKYGIETLLTIAKLFLHKFGLTKCSLFS